MLTSTKISPKWRVELLCIVGSTMKMQSKHINWNFELPDLIDGKNNYPTYQNDSLKEVDLPMTCDDCWRSRSLGTLSGDLLQLHEPSAAVGPAVDLLSKNHTKEESKLLAEQEPDRTEDFKNVRVMMTLIASYVGYLSISLNLYWQISPWRPCLHP